MIQELNTAFHRPIILVDDQKTKVGYFMGLGTRVNADQVNLMVKHGRGLVYVCITEEKAKKLSLPLMIQSQCYDANVLSAVSVDLKINTTGISAFERAATIRAFVDEGTTGEDFRKPGHVFPLIVRQHGRKRGTTIPEIALQLANLVSKKPVAFICEILNHKGEIATCTDLKHLSRLLHVKMYRLSEIKSLVNKQCVWDHLKIQRHMIHWPDLQFVHWCEEQYGVNRGVYNVIDAWFYNQGLDDIVERRVHILEFLSFQAQNLSKGNTLKFGSGGLKTRLNQFWSQKFMLNKAIN